MGNLDEAFEKILKARAAIMEKEGDRRKVAGEIECPCCGGKLKYTIASNGHVWGCCEECVRWME